MKIAITSPTNKLHAATCGHLAKHTGDVKYATGQRAQDKIAKTVDGHSGLTLCGNCAPKLEAELAGR